MKKIGKYEFDSEQQADDMIRDLGIVESPFGEILPNHNHTVVKLWSYNKKYLVDVLWKDLEPIDLNADVLEYTHPNGWEQYAIDIDNNGVHSFLGLDYNDYKF